MRKKAKLVATLTLQCHIDMIILIKTTLCTAVFYTVQTEQAGDFLGPGRK